MNAEVTVPRLRKMDNTSYAFTLPHPFLTIIMKSGYTGSRASWKNTLEVLTPGTYPRMTGITSNPSALTKSGRHLPANAARWLKWRTGIIPTTASCHSPSHSPYIDIALNTQTGYRYPFEFYFSKGR